MDLVELDFERAKVFHLLFKTNLRSILYGISVDEKSVMDHQNCEIGKWLNGYALGKFGHIPEMQELAKIHKKLHQHSLDLIQVYKQGAINKAREGLITIELLSGTMTTLLSIVELKLKSEAAGQQSVSGDLTVNYQELLQFHETLLTLDERIRKEMDNSNEAREKVEESESKFRNTMMQAPVGIIILRGADLVVEMANDTYLQIVDRIESEFVGRPLFASLPEVKVAVKPILDAVLQTGIPYYGNEFKVTLIRAGRPEQVYFNFVYQPLLEEDLSISGIIVVATEVTQQVKAKHALQQSENQFRNLVTQSPFAKAVLDGKDMVITIANETMLRDLWKRELREVQGRKLMDVFPELTGQRFPEILREVYLNGVTYKENEAVAYIESKDGTKKHYLDYQYAPMFDLEGAVSGVLVSVNDVTEKVEARQLVHDSAERLSLATEGTQLATWDLNLENRQLVYTPRLNQLFGQPESQVLTQEGLRAQLHPYDRVNIVEKAFTSALKSGTYSYEARVIHPDQSEHWIRTQGKIIFDADQKPLRMLGTMMDITRQKQAERIIEESEKRYRDLIQALPVAVYTVDEKGMINLFNEAAVKLWGRVPELGKELWSESYALFTQDGLPLTEENGPMGVALKEKRVLIVEGYVKQPDGNVRHVIENPKPIFDSSGHIAGALNVVIDITDSREAEFALRTSEGKFRTLADSMPQLIWTGDSKGDLNYYNQSVFDYTGLTYEDLERDGWLHIVHPEERELTMSLWEGAVSTGNDFSCEHRFRKADGAYRWQLSRAIPQRDADGIIQMWVGTSTDIHDSKLFIDELESKVQQRTSELTVMNDELVRTNIELGQFAYVASHDLQEPLRKIQTFSSRIMETERNNLSERGKDYFTRMQASSTRMQQLIVDLLAFSRANAVERNFERTDLNRLLNNVTEQLQESIQQKGAIIRASNLPELNVIVYQFEQLFTNLITNFLKFVRVGVRPEMQITSGFVNGNLIDAPGAIPDKSYLYISFEDNGIGFDPEFTDRIFQVFQRLHSKNSYEGTGIGLAICKKIVDNHQGLITAIGKPDVGATFIIYFPGL
jgi:PAS domain S-box-containing protein